MNCARVRQEMLRYEDIELPPDLVRHIEGCPDCRRHAEQVKALRQLLALKNYERPSPRFEERLIAGVRRRIEHPDEDRALAPGMAWSWPRAARDWPIPAFRYALAAVFALLVGVHLLSIPTLAPLAPVVAENRPAVPVAPTFRSVLPPPGLPPVRIPIAVASTGGAGRIEYGPGASSLVNFDY